MKYLLIAYLTLHSMTLAGQAALAQPAVSSPTNAAALEQRYKEALDLYHKNNPDAALSTLKELRRSNPRDVRYLYDYIAIASWSGNHESALAASKDASLDAAPAYVIEAIASSQRQRAMYSDALATYDKAIRRFPDRIDPRIGKLNVLLDSKRYDEAASDLFHLQRAHADRDDLQRIALRLNDAPNQAINVLALSQKILAENPRSTFGQRIRFHALEKLGAAHLAAQLTPPSVLSRSDQLSAARDQMAFDLRWARISSDRSRQPGRWDDMDAAISNLREACAQADTEGSDQELAQGACGDLVVALSDRQHNRESIALHQKMVGRKWKIPAYVDFSAAEAYLEDHQPERARDLFASALPQDPDNVDARLGYVYALWDCGQYNDAYRMIDRYASETTALTNPGLAEVRGPNPDYVRVQVAAAVIRSYTDLLAEAQRRLEPLASDAPFNPEIRDALASTYGLRGWHRRAEEDFEWLNAVFPEDIPAQLGLFENRLAINDFRGAEQQLNAASGLMPLDRDVRKDRREWETHSLRELLVDARYGKSSGDTDIAPTGSREASIDARLYSTPYDYDWRFFAHTQVAWTTLPEMNVTRTAVGGGAEFRRRDVTVTGEVFNMETYGTGLSLDTNYLLNDKWYVTGLIERNGLSTPVRAYAYGVSTSNFQVGTGYRWNESRSVDFAVSEMIFSDGNHRHTVDSSWTERLLTYPQYKLDSIVEYQASGNSSQDPQINYFNPASDRYLGVNLQNEWLQFHREERSLKHVLTLSGGNYAQENYSSGKALSLVYEQTYQRDARLEFHYGVGRTLHPYDGATVAENFITGGVNWKF
jgi:biofilm PGA synthesis protein PgaA